MKNRSLAVFALFSLISIAAFQNSFAAGSAVIQPGSWEKFSAPDDKTLQWLGERVKGLELSKVRQVPADMAEAVMGTAADQQWTFLDILTENILKEDKAYFVSRETLERLDSKFTIYMPITHQTDDKKPKIFKMLGFLMGNGILAFIYENNRGDINFTSDKQAYKITEGLVFCTIQGSGDINIAGFEAYGGALAAWKYVKVIRMRKVSPNSPGKGAIKVKASIGPEQDSEVSPITRKK